MELELDYNIELFPLSKGDHVAVALASSLSREPVGVAAEGEEADNKNTWRPGISANPGLEEDHDYVMFGKVCGEHTGRHTPLTRCADLQVRREYRGEIVRNLYPPTSTCSPRYRTVYASFGGLLMALTGNNRHLQNLTLGESVYILLRK